MGEWACSECKTCEACPGSNSAGWVFRCASCVRHFHIGCADPPPEQRTVKRPWRCRFCLEHHQLTPHRPSKLKEKSLELKKRRCVFFFFFYLSSMYIYICLNICFSTFVKNHKFTQFYCFNLFFSIIVCFRLSSMVKGRKNKLALNSSPETDEDVSEGNNLNIPILAVKSDQRMSKEKQKFFRLSAFNHVKNKKLNKEVNPTPWNNSNVNDRIGTKNKCRCSDSESSEDGISDVRKRPLRKPYKPVDSDSSSDSKLDETAYDKMQYNNKFTSDVDNDRSSNLGFKINPNIVKSNVPMGEISHLSSPNCRESSENSSSSLSCYDLNKSDGQISVKTNSLPTIAQYNPTFDRLGASITAGSDSKWGFAAEAEKKFSVLPQKPVACLESTRTFGNFQQSRTKDRLLNTLFDGLSEFYAVRNGYRNRAKKKFDSSAKQREVLKETRSTYKMLNCSVERNEKNVEPSDDLKYKLVPTKDEYASNFQQKYGNLHPGAESKNDWVSNTFVNFLNKSLPMTPSNLVKTAVYAKRHELSCHQLFKSYDPSNTVKIVNNYNVKSVDDQPNDCDDFLSTYQFRKQQIIAEATAINESTLLNVRSTINETGKNS